MTTQVVLANTQANTMQLQTVETLSPGQNLNAYLQAVNSFAILSPEEELRLAEEYHYNENLEAARQLVLAHMRFVVHIAKSYNGYGLNLGDLIQEGNVGLMKAVKRFNPEKGVRLVSFAVHWIKAEIHEFVLKNWRIVKVATTKAQRKLFFNLRSSKERLAWLSHDEAKAIADDLGVSLKDVHEMEGRLSAHDAAFDGFQDDDEDNAYQAPAYYLEDKSHDPAARLEKDNWESNTYGTLATAIQGLDERSQDIIRSRWLDEDNKATLHDLADKYGISAERIRQLEKNAMKKVKAVLEA